MDVYTNHILYLRECSKTYNNIKMDLKFSVFSIDKNESNTLPDLIESCKEFRNAGGEYVYMDTGSNDDGETMKVLKQYENQGVKVFCVGERFITILSKIQAQRINSIVIDKEK